MIGICILHCGCRKGLESTDLAVLSAQCGLRKQLSSSYNGLSSGRGSVSNTSNAAPLIRFSWRAAISRKQRVTIKFSQPQMINNRHLQPAA